MHQLIKDAKGRMDKTIETLRSELSKIRTGKATTVLLDSIKLHILEKSGENIKTIKDKDKKR